MLNRVNTLKQRIRQSQILAYSMKHGCWQPLQELLLKKEMVHGCQVVSVIKADGQSDTDLEALQRTCSTGYDGKE